jgi:hypothetical protein
MIRIAIAVVVGLIIWILGATALDVLWRLALSGYAAATDERGRQTEFTTLQ